MARCSGPHAVGWLLPRRKMWRDLCSEFRTGFRGWDHPSLTHRVSIYLLFADVSTSTLVFQEFYFKCANHAATMEHSDRSVGLELVKSNAYQVPCVTCLEIAYVLLWVSFWRCHFICKACRHVLAPKPSSYKLIRTSNKTEKKWKFTRLHFPGIQY